MSWRRSLTVLVCLATPSLAVAQDKFFDADGARIHYIEQGTGEPVLLLHGQGNNVDLWSGVGLLQELSARYHVVAFDARGHGKSDKPHDPRLYGRQLALDAVRLMDHLMMARPRVAASQMPS